MNAPCKNCNKRELNCHSTCEEYKKFRKFKDETRDKKTKFQVSEEYFSDRNKRRKK